VVTLGRTNGRISGKWEVEDCKKGHPWVKKGKNKKNMVQKEKGGVVTHMQGHAEVSRSYVNRHLRKHYGTQ